MNKATLKKTVSQPNKDEKRPKSIGKDEKVKADKIEAPKRKNSNEEDSQKPKKALSSYMMFAKENREKIKTKFPDSKPTEIMSKLGDAWKDLKESDKKKYEDLANKDKERYQKEMETYNASANNNKPAKKEVKKKPAQKEESNLIF
jgi:hypothetical protein